MSKALTESVRMIEKGYRRKLRKQRWEQQIPSFRNFNLDVSYKDSIEELRIIITDLLNIDSKATYSKISSVGPKGSTYLITSVLCPVCHQPVELNIHWNCFLCNHESHPKKAFEITKVIVEE